MYCSYGSEKGSPGVVAGLKAATMGAGMYIRKFSCDILNKAVLAIIYDHIGRRSQVPLSRLERARYICGVGNVDFDWKRLAVRHIHAGTRFNCDFEVVLDELESNGLWVGCGISVLFLFSTKILGQLSDLSHATACSENESDCNEGCGWRGGRVQGFESTKAWGKVLHFGPRRWYIKAHRRALERPN